MNRLHTAQAIIEELFNSYHNLYEKFGVQPNTFLLSRDLITVLRNEYFGRLEVLYEGDSRKMRIDGLNVVVVEGLCVAKAAIIEENEHDGERSTKMVRKI